MSTVQLPASDVVSTGHPYRVKIKPAAGDAVNVSVNLRHRQLGSAVSDELSLPVLDPAENIALCLDASALAEGEYEGTLVIEEGESHAEQRFTLFRMAEPVCLSPDFGIYAIPGKPEELDWVFGELQKMGVTLIQEHTWGLSGIVNLVDKAARYGMRFQPSLRYWTPETIPEVFAETENAMAVRFSADAARQAQENVPYEFSTKTPCLNHPKVRAFARANTAAYLREYRTHPAFSGKVYFGDDLFLPTFIQQGKANLACTCTHCRDDYRARTGHEVPMAPEILRGVVEPDHSWLVWMRYRVEHEYADFVREIEAARAEVDDAIEVGLCHGFPDNPFVSLAHGLYSPQTQPGAVVSSYCYPFLRSPSADFIVHYEIGKMGNREKPVWMLGVCGADRVAVPGWHVRQNYWNMLAAGYDLMGFFSWHDYYHLLTKDGARLDKEKMSKLDLERIEESMAAVAQCGVHKNWVLPASKHWQRPRAKVAVLYSFTTEAFDVAPEYRGILHSKRICEFYRHCLRRQVEAEVICEEEVRSGKLAEYDALCLPDARVLPRDVKVLIDAFAAEGGRLLTAPDYLYVDSWHPNMTVEFEGGTEMAAETMAVVLAAEQGIIAECDNADVTIRRFVSGDVAYYVVVNNFADRYHGMTYTYGNPQADYDRAAVVRDEPVQVNLTVPGDGGTVVDLSTGARVGRAGEAFVVALEPSWGRVFAVMPVSEVKLRMVAVDTATLGKSLSVGLTLGGNDGKLVNGSFTVLVKVISPSGRVLSGQSFVDIETGGRTLEIPIADNEESGVWTLTAEGGFPRKTVTQTVTVEQGSADIGSILSISASSKN